MSDGPRGRHLEELVRSIEQAALPDDAQVHINKRYFDDNGIQLSEFDVLVEAKLGTGKISWLLECRDRPSQGSAPASWIQELAGRKTAFGLHKITAVSTTGFSDAATVLAKKLDVEVRTLDSITVTDVDAWCRLGVVRKVMLRGRVNNVGMSFHPEDLQRLIGMGADMLPISAPNELHLTLESPTEPRSVMNLLDSFILGVANCEEIREKLQVNEPMCGLVAQLEVQEPQSAILDTPYGPLRLTRAHIYGDAWLEEIEVPSHAIGVYRDVASNVEIAEYASHTVVAGGKVLELDLHRDSSTRKISASIRDVADDALGNTVRDGELCLQLRFGPFE